MYTLGWVMRTYIQRQQRVGRDSNTTIIISFSPTYFLFVYDSVVVVYSVCVCVCRCGAVHFHRTRIPSLPPTTPFPTPAQSARAIRYFDHVFCRRWIVRARRDSLTNVIDSRRILIKLYIYWSFDWQELEANSAILLVFLFFYKTFMLIELWECSVPRRLDSIFESRKMQITFRFGLSLSQYCRNLYIHRPVMDKGKEVYANSQKITRVLL